MTACRIAFSDASCFSIVALSRLLFILFACGVLHGVCCAASQFAKGALLSELFDAD